MSRYKYTKLKNLGPVHGFFINTPDGRTIKDIYPEFIVRELNRLNERIKRLESVENSHADVLKAIGNWIKQQEAKEAKP